MIGCACPCANRLPPKPQPKHACGCEPGRCRVSLQDSSCFVRMAANLGIDIVHVRPLDEPEVSTETDYGAIQYPRGILMTPFPAQLRSKCEFRVVSESEHEWAVEYRVTIGGSTRQWFRYGEWTFRNPQSAYAWLEETGRA